MNITQTKYALQYDMIDSINKMKFKRIYIKAGGFEFVVAVSIYYFNFRGMSINRIELLKSIKHNECIAPQLKEGRL